ncbi:hypothetical protein KIN20_018979 [Parelaphostrongylus tenuis]|uniref:Uncharacterized protein n=1 Tax=Parelaphostrongylus tenuis TaxID=148309 RepID=A0AAD5MK79_PARTN|nr:hypothetical protein KIN20_018979 [Parelaphostrongylus tenuis]
MLIWRQNEEFRKSCAISDRSHRNFAAGHILDSIWMWCDTCRPSKHQDLCPGFTLAVAMVYTNMAMISAQHPGIADSRDGVRAFVSRIVMQTVFDVLESDGRRALLPDAVISSILGQLNVTIIYEPM